MILAEKGVETVNIDRDSSKVTVTGKVDPVKLREKVEAKTHKKIVLVSPQPSNGKAKGGDGGEKQKKNGNDEDKKKDTEKEVRIPCYCFPCCYCSSIVRTSRFHYTFLPVCIHLWFVPVAR